MQARLLTFKSVRVTAAAIAFAMTCAFAPAQADEPATVTVKVVSVRRESISQPVRAYGVVAGSASNATTVSLPYVARIVRVLVQPGQRVARGAPLFVVQADPAAVTAMAQAKSAEALARGELARTGSLYREGLATQSQLDTARKALDDAQQALAAQTRLGVSARPHTVAAPAAGVVSQVSAAQGDQVQAGTAIAQLVAENAGAGRVANVMLGVEPAQVQSVGVGDRVVLRALSAALGDASAVGQVMVVGASIDAQSQLVNVGAAVPVQRTAFIPGTRVRADIATRTATLWVVPRAAVLQDGKGRYVFQVTRAGAAHRVPVVVQIENGERYGVEGALDAARPLVVSGNYELHDGMAVRVAAGGAQ